MGRHVVVNLANALPPEYLDTPHSGPAWTSCSPPESSQPPPFIRGVLSAGNRRYFSTAIQLTTRHAFTADYSVKVKFRPDAGDNLICPCSSRPPFTLHTTEHVLLSCTLLGDARARSFGSNTNLPHIFGTEAGGRQLCDFLHATQVLLHPLPPRPDLP